MNEDLNTSPPHRQDEIDELKARPMFMPSTRYIDCNVTLAQIKGVNYNFTAPSDGYLLVCCRCGNNSPGYVGTWSDPFYANYENWVPASGVASIFLPMRKGMSVLVRCSEAITSLDRFRFIYAEGAY